MFLNLRKKTFWIYRYYRSFIASIATVGAVETGYLTLVKLTQGTAACPTESCDLVLSSPYATIFGLPLTLFGFLGYLSMIVLAVMPLCVTSPQKIQGFPTWEIKGKLYQGEKTLTELASLSGYQGELN